MQIKDIDKIIEIYSCKVEEMAKKTRARKNLFSKNSESYKVLDKASSICEKTIQNYKQTETFLKSRIVEIRRDTETFIKQINELLLEMELLHDDVFTKKTKEDTILNDDEKFEVEWENA